MFFIICGYKDIEDNCILYDTWVFFLIFRKFRIIKKRLSIDLQQITLYISIFFNYCALGFVRTLNVAVINSFKFLSEGIGRLALIIFPFSSINI